VKHKKLVIGLGMIGLFVLLSCQLSRAAGLAVSAGQSLVATSTATSTPTRTVKPTWTTIPTATLTDDWFELQGHYFTVALPVDWDTFNVESDGVETTLRKLSRIDDRWSETETWLLEDEDIQDNVMVISREDNPSNAMDTSLRLFSYSMEGTIRSRHLCDGIEEQYEEDEEVSLKGIRCGLDINGLDGARVDVQYLYRHYMIREITYYYISGKGLWVLEFHVLESQLTKYEDLIDEIGNSFRAVQQKPVSWSAGDTGF